MKEYTITVDENELILLLNALGSLSRVLHDRIYNYTFDRSESALPVIITKLRRQKVDALAERLHTMKDEVDKSPDEMTSK